MFPYAQILFFTICGSFLDPDLKPLITKYEPAENRRTVKAIIE